MQILQVKFATNEKQHEDEHVLTIYYGVLFWCYNAALR